MPQTKDSIQINAKFEAKISQKSEVEVGFSKELFHKFLKELPSFYSILNKTVPFSYCYWWFSWRKIDKATARKILRQWNSLGFCHIVPYHGLRVSSNFKDKDLKEDANSTKEQDKIYFQLKKEVERILKGEKKDG